MRKLEVAVATKPAAVKIGKNNLFLVTCWKQKIIICNEAVGVCWIWGSTEDQILIKKHKHFSSVIISELTKIKTFFYWVTSVDGKVAIISFVSWHSKCLHSPCNREFVSARGMVTSLRKTHDNTQHRLFPLLTHSISFLTEPLILKCVESVSCATLNWWYEETTERSEFFWDHLIKDWVTFFSHLTDRIQPNRLISLFLALSLAALPRKSLESHLKAVEWVSHHSRCLSCR